jgi:hypothetical protein
VRSEALTSAQPEEPLQTQAPAEAGEQQPSPALGGAGRSSSQVGSEAQTTQVPFDMVAAEQSMQELKEMLAEADELMSDANTMVFDNGPGDEDEENKPPDASNVQQVARTQTAARSSFVARVSGPGASVSLPGASAAHTTGTVREASPSRSSSVRVNAVTGLIVEDVDGLSVSEWTDDERDLKERANKPRAPLRKYNVQTLLQCKYYFF